MIISKTVFYFLANLVTLLLLNYLVDGFDLITQPVNLLSTALIFTIFNTYIRPVVKYFFTIFIILSFGLFGLAINGGVLYLLDFLSENINITGSAALIYSTLLITLVNIVISVWSRTLFKKRV